MNLRVQNENLKQVEPRSTSTAMSQEVKLCSNHRSAADFEAKCEHIGSFSYTEKSKIERTRKGKKTNLLIWQGA